MSKKIIIDCDPGIDDTLAILLASSISDYDIQGIIVTSGNVHRDKGLINVFRLCNFIQKSYPIYKGIEYPLCNEFVNAEDTHGIDGLGETFLKYTELSSSDSAVDFLLANASQSTIFALGPLTNIAYALERNKNSFRNSRLICMGGTYKSHGNCSPVAEFNFWVDPHAAKYVLDNFPGKVEVIPLDVTRKFVLTPNIISFIKKMDINTGIFIEKITNFYMDFHWKYENIIGSVINDPLTFILDLHPEIFNFIDVYADISTDNITKGMLVVDDHNFYKKPANIRLCTDIDSKLAMMYFLKYILPETSTSEIYKKYDGGLYEFKY